MVGARVARDPATLSQQLLQVRQDIVQIAQLIACMPATDRATIELTASAAAQQIAYLEAIARRAER